LRAYPNPGKLLNLLAHPTRFERVTLPSESSGPSGRPVGERRSQSIARIGCCGPHLWTYDPRRGCV